MKRIKMILTNKFGPDPRPYKEAKTLVQNGYDVEILCWDREGNFVDKSKENIDGIKITRFFPKSQYGSGFKQLSAFRQFVSELKTYLSDKDYDVLHGHDIDGAYAAVKINPSIKIIWDMHEFYELVVGSKMKIATYHLSSFSCFRHVDGIIYSVDTQIERYSHRLKKHTLTEVVKNSPEQEIFLNYNRKSSEKLRIAFIGKVREYEEMKKLMDVGEKFKNVEIHIAGDGVAYEPLKQIKDQYKNTYLYGRYTYKDILKYYENCDIIYTIYNKSNKNSKRILPVKGLEAIITETPVICAESYFADLVEKYDIGFVIDNSEESLYTLISNILENKNIFRTKANNIKKISHMFVWDNEARKLLNFYNNICK